MIKRIQIQTLIAIMTAGLLFSSCGNVDIVKRKYRPGFHVDVSKKREKKKVTEVTATADSRKAEQLTEVELKYAQAFSSEHDQHLTVQTSESAPLSAEVVKKERMKEVLSAPDFGNLSFKRQMRTIQNKLLGPKAPSSDAHWMAWVSFGTGAGSALFGLIALIVAFFGVMLWPLAIVLGAAAIVFAIIHAKKGYSGERFRKLGLLLGIIGAGLGLIAMIIWIVWAVGGFGGRYWWY